MDSPAVSSIERNSSSLSNQSPSTSSVDLVATTATTATSRHFSRSEQIARHFFFYWLHQSPHWDFRSFGTLQFKAKKYCDALLQQFRDDPDIFFKRLVRKFIKDLQPLTYLVQTCLQHLPVKLVRQSMELHEMLDKFVVPLVDERLKAIRSAIRNRKVFISLTIEEFIIFSDVVTKKRLKEDKIMDYLFVVVGLCEQPEKRFVVKVVKLLEDEQDDLSDRFFANVVMDSLNLLWPTNSDQMISTNLTYLMGDPELELDELVLFLRQNNPNVFSNLVYTPYTHRAMHRIETRLRKEHSTVSLVIDTVRIQWDKCPAFQDSFRGVSANLVPPETFYRSVEFYRDNFEAVQLGVLKWRTNRTIEARVALSDVDFQQDLLENFAEHAKLLLAIERANYARPYELSLQVAALAVELQLMSQDLMMHQNDTSLQEYIDWYSKALQDELVSTGQTIYEITQTGEYQLLNLLIRDTQFGAYYFHSELTKLFLVKSIAESRFSIPNTIPTTNKVEQWVEPLCSSQLRKCFPKFWYLFRKFYTPFPYEYMESCAMVYCYAEADN